jgi:hypothetical protein
MPMACLAAILIMIGLKLASPKVFKHMWKAGKYQFIPFIVTVVAVVGNGSAERCRHWIAGKHILYPEREHETCLLL